MHGSARVLVDKLKREVNIPERNPKTSEKSGRRGAWFGIGAVALVALAGFLVYQDRNHASRVGSLNDPKVSTFTRADHTPVTCTAARPSVVEAARSLTVRAGVDSAVKAAQGGIVDGSSLERIRSEMPGTDLFEVKKFALCEAYGNNALTKQQYSDLLAYLIRNASK